MQFSNKIIYLLNKRKWTQNQMIRDLNLGKNAMVHWRNNNNLPCAETLLKLSEYFKVPVDFLLGNTDAFLSENFIANELDDEMLCKAIELLRNEAQKRNIL